MNTEQNTLPLHYFPDLLLRKKCEPITQIDATVRQLAEKMRNTMRVEKGIGLAAPQVGRLVRLFVADVSEDYCAPLVLVNPEITAREGEIIYQEGCLSVPTIRAPIKRARHVCVQGLSLEEKQVEIEASDLLAVCIQHEIDHLNGVLFFDHLSALKRDRLLKKYQPPAR